MLIKAGVDISRLKPEIRKKLNVMAQIVWEREKQELVITSTYEGVHSASSLHYTHLAVDIRSGDHKDEVKDWLDKWLGKDYDIVLEGDHIHIEFDPK